MNQTYSTVITDNMNQSNSYYSTSDSNYDSQPLMSQPQQMPPPIVVQSQYNQPPPYNDVNTYQNAYMQQPQQYYNPYHQSFIERYIKYVYLAGFFLLVPWILIVCLLRKSDNPDMQEYRRKSKRWSIIYSIILAIILVFVLICVGISELAEYIDNTDIDDVTF